jgi:hypothetical protein
MGSPAWRDAERALAVIVVLVALYLLGASAGLWPLWYSRAEHERIEKYRETKETLRALRAIINEYENATLTLPATVEVVAKWALRSESPSAVRLREKELGVLRDLSLEKLTLDSWGNRIVLLKKKGYVELVSGGPDGVFGSPDDLYGP